MHLPLHSCFYCSLNIFFLSNLFNLEPNSYYQEPEVKAPNYNRSKSEYNDYKNQRDYNDHNYEDNDDNDEYEGTILKTVKHISNSNNTINRNHSPERVAYASSAYDQRPIKPLKSKIESVFDDDGIPSDPQLTNEYYKNFDDFEQDEQSSPERKLAMRYAASKTLGPKSSFSSVSRKAQSSRPNRGPRNVAASKTFSSSQPRSSKAVRNEYEQLIDAIEGAISNNKTESNLKHIFFKSEFYKGNLINFKLAETFGDDSRTGVFGAYNRATKIQNLRA